MRGNLDNTGSGFGNNLHLKCWFQRLFGKNWETKCVFERWRTFCITNVPNFVKIHFSLAIKLKNAQFLVYLIAYLCDTKLYISFLPIPSIWTINSDLNNLKKNGTTIQDHICIQLIFIVNITLWNIIPQIRELSHFTC